MSANPDARSRVEISRLVTTFSNMVAQGAEVELRSGTVNLVNSQWVVSSGGVTVSAVWNNNLIPYDGAQCVLALATIGSASIYYVMYITDVQPAMSGPATVTAFTGGASTCTVSINGTNYTAHRVASYTPAVNDVCLVLDMAGDLYAVGALTTYTPPPKPASPPPPPPPATTTGSSLYTATDSGTWTGAYGGWNSYYGQNVYTGSGYVPPSTGAWFYAGHTRGVAGKTINYIRFYLPPRRNAGSYNSTLTLHLYAHTAWSRGNAEPHRNTSAFSLNVGAHFGGGWISLPGSFAATLQGGGGISIAGDPYMGFTGVGESGSSGALQIGWSA
jgi:hypothetical protein